MRGSCDPGACVWGAACARGGLEQIGSTPLHEASWEGHSSVVPLLLAANADVNAKGWVRLRLSSRAACAAGGGGGLERRRLRPAGRTGALRRVALLARAADEDQVALAELERGVDRLAQSAERIDDAPARTTRPARAGESRVKILRHD